MITRKMAQALHSQKVNRLTTTIWPKPTLLTVPSKCGRNKIATGWLATNIRCVDTTNGSINMWVRPK